MSGKRKTALATACAFTWFGHACGASMATGRLAVQYCSLHGPIGLVGAVVVWIASVAFAWIIMEYARLIKAENYHDVVKTIYWPNRILGSVMNVVWDLITLFSVVVVSGTCIAGSGALLESAFGLNYYIGMVLFTALMLLIFLSGGGVLKKLGGISVPMLVLLIIMCVVIITMVWDNLKAVMAGELNSYIEPGKETLGSTVLDGITYGMTQSGFVATGIVYSRQFESRKETNKACLLGFLFGTASMVMCTLAALAWFPGVNNETLPYLTVLQQLSGAPGSIFRVVYYVVLYIAYISTAGSLLLGGISRYKLLLGKAVKNEKVCTSILIVFFLCASTVIGSLGLTAIVDRGYKMLGGMRSWTWFYPLLILGPISIHRVGKMLKEKGEIVFPAGVGAVKAPPAQDEQEQGEK